MDPDERQQQQQQQQQQQDASFKESVHIISSNDSNTYEENCVEVEIDIGIELEGTKYGSVADELLLADREELPLTPPPPPSFESTSPLEEQVTISGPGGADGESENETCVQEVVADDFAEREEITPHELTPLLGEKEKSTSFGGERAASSLADDDNNEKEEDDKKGVSEQESTSNSDKRKALFLFLEAQTAEGLLYEAFTIILILLSVVSFVVSSLFIPQYEAIPQSMIEKCGPLCDALFFGNDEENSLKWLGIGPTSLLEISIVLVFTIDYGLRLYTADLIDPMYKGFIGRLRFVPTFFSLVDLVSTVPFYVDAFFLPNRNLAASSFLRMFRLLRMMRMEGRYDLALNLLDDVIYEQKGIMGVGLFVGFTTWTLMASFFYVAERRNNDMIYCGAAPERCFADQDDIDTSLCVIDEYGFVDCSAAGCETLEGEKEPCWNVYRSIIDASFWTLMELFGEFPLVDQHSVWGKIFGTLTAVIAVAVFALPTGILGSGFEEIIGRRRQERSCDIEQNFESAIVKVNSCPEDDVDLVMDSVVGDQETFRGVLYNFLHLESTLASRYFDHFINFLIVGTSLTFMFDTLSGDFLSPLWYMISNAVELFAAITFTIEYCLRLYSVAEHPKYEGLRGRVTYATSFEAIVDLLSFLPYWIDAVLSHHLTTASDNSSSTNVVKCFRLLRLLRFEKYTKAFTTFDDIIRESVDVLTVTGFSALLLWVLFSAILYYTERDNPNLEMANYYKSVPHSMWITLLNLSGECPLAFYTMWGKVVTGIIGLFATAVFGIPIGILGAGFEELVTSRNEDTPDKLTENDQENITNVDSTRADEFQIKCYEFVNGLGSNVAMIFELTIYALIAASIAVGIIQTVDGQEDTFHQLEWIAVLIFTFEYVLRFIGSPADPEFSCKNNLNIFCSPQLRYLFSFYSIVDLLAILPFYLSIALPESWFDKHDEYLRMFRLLRLLKLEKYVPSISLIDDVLRLKKNALVISCYAGATIWILCGGFMYLAEYKDHSMEIDNVPLYGCDENCTMSDRYRNYFTSISYTFIHLTGDFPMVEYGLWGRIVCFFMVIAAVGVVSIPSGLIASGFTEIVSSKARKNGEQPAIVGDDWYEKRYRDLEGQSPPSSPLGPRVDQMQLSVHTFLNGAEDRSEGAVKRSAFSRFGRNFFFGLIVTNVLAVIIESIPEVDRSVGNDKGNFFDIFEEVSIFFFTVEYLLRLFSAPKSRTALYSSWTYARTFFGIVDLLSIAPWYAQQVLMSTGNLNGDEAQVFRIVRIFRILQLEDFVIAFSKLDNAFRASKDVLKATGLLAIIIWCGSSALFYIFEQDNPNLRQCKSSIPLVGSGGSPGCYDFESTTACNAYYPGMCEQTMFTNMPNTMYYVAVFLVGDWGFVDFSWEGRLVCFFLCLAGIALYAIPTGTLFDAFGAVIGIVEEDEEENED